MRVVGKRVKKQFYVLKLAVADGCSDQNALPFSFQWALNPVRDIFYGI